MFSKNIPDSDLDSGNPRNLPLFRQPPTKEQNRASGRGSNNAYHRSTSKRNPGNSLGYGESFTPLSRSSSKQSLGSQSSLNSEFESGNPRNMHTSRQFPNHKPYKASHFDGRQHSRRTSISLSINDLTYNLDNVHIDDGSSVNNSSVSDLSGSSLNLSSSSARLRSTNSRQVIDNHPETMEKLSIHYLSSLCSMNNNVFTRRLNDCHQEFKNFFAAPIRFELMETVFKFITRLCSIDYECSKKSFLNTILSSKEFLKSVNSFVEKIIEYSRTEARLNANVTMSILFIFNAVDYIPLDQLSNYKLLASKISQISKKCDGIPADFILKLDKCNDLLTKKIEVHKEEIITYKSLSVFPTYDELFQEPNLNVINVVQGPYESVSQYIDVQFKLLKEDYISGLRHGIYQYLEEVKTKVKFINHDIFVYKSVKYVGLSQDDHPLKNVLHKFTLDHKSLEKVKWENSKRLIHGSLVFFSDDSFKTLCMGVLDDRKKTEGDMCISVFFVGKSLKINKKSEFVMIESRNFFEPYYQVCNALKDLHPQSFPMYKYIVLAETELNPPKYLKPNARFTIGGYELAINNPHSWSELHKIGLNESQSTALHAALSREFVVIQGPPGTGKTYLGIKIINILLDNKEVWSDGKSPIFIACYRNGAVDQILDSLADPEAENHRNVVRLGNRSSSDILKDCTLKNAVGSRRDPVMFEELKVLKVELSDLKRKIYEFEKLKLFVTEKKGILDHKVFTKLFTTDQRQFFSSLNAYENWLLEDDDDDDLFFDEDDKLIQGLLNQNQRKKENDYLNQTHSFIFLSINDLISELKDLDDILAYLSSLNDDSVLQQMSNIAVQYHLKINTLRKILRRIHMYETDASIEELLRKNLASLNIIERWTLYNHWANELVKTCENQIDYLIESHDKKLLDFRYKRDQNDGENLRFHGVDVVGATTTGAARLNRLLSVIKPKIVVIEEAAEILEAHTITSLSEHCEHLILIGDHKQLKPSPASHASSVKYHMDISLFERMILNGMEYYSLREQHRMRPEISALVSPHFYQDLMNHPSVEDYPDVIGFKKNLFFIDHEVSEDQLTNNDSHQNKYEAKFVLKLANYIIKQGYEESRVTVLTPYVAQLLLLKSMKEKYPSLNDVAFEVVDNFQGEENDIIVLSLVRSNSSTIGFLSKDNRVCVALSRAKIGFFMIGNMGTLHKNSHVWKEIKNILSDQSSIDAYLPLKCKTHKKITKVNSPQDFDPLLNGGCTEECGLELPCGHKCNYMCHPNDTDHAKIFLCNKPCPRKRNCNIHDCTAECGVECPPCDIRIPHLLECEHWGFKLCGGGVLNCDLPCPTSLDCGHTCPRKCHLDDDDHAMIKCKAVCDKLNPTCPFKHKCPKLCKEECGKCEIDSIVELDCGHPLKGICFQISDKECEVQVDRSLLCGHTIKAQCSDQLMKIKCTEVEKIHLDCGHEVETVCGTRKNDINCNVMVEKLLPCQHKKETLCSIPAEEILCDKAVDKTLSCGHAFKNTLCSSSEANLMCEYKVLKTLSCGHDMEVNCGDKNPLCSKSMVLVNESCGHNKIISCADASLGSTETSAPEEHKCDEPCNEILPCKHQCRGTCGSCMQGHVHDVCNAVCGAMLICGHKCTTKCWIDFHSCKSVCLNVCKHMKCNRSCGEICEKCTEPCEWACSHYRCTKRCWEVCDRPQCSESCLLNLPCGHPCLGLCGEPCPPLCSICSPEAKIDTTDRLILLEDCGHSVHQNILKLMMTKAVGLLRCPECSEPIIKTNYMSVCIKYFFLKYPKVKHSSSEHYNNKRFIIRDFCQNFKILNVALKKEYKGCQSLTDLLRNLLVRTVPIMQNKMTRESKLELKTLLFICFYVTEALKITSVDAIKEHTEVYLAKIDIFASYLLKRSKGKISPREMHQFYQELIRLKCMIDLIILKQEDSCNDETNVQKYKEVANAILLPKQFIQENQSKSERLLLTLKKDFKSNHQLICSNVHNSDKILEFFGKYYPIYYHMDKWLKCKNNHHFYCKDDSQNTCPVCSNKEANNLFF